ncbi:hypothetical protein [Novosphingobium sp. fls2-241-R2A-195]|uniref:hypothetical protein n=1 Tax=Novosphingobium sp. fls2-241-R2A-195 TaxID=3040296 RepID=UPI00254AF9B2|nr:hypothetical protein [Novosphingobium sp. fls2-241-R2A-195]
MADTDWVSALLRAYPTLTARHVEIVEHLVNGFTKSVDATQYRTDFISTSEFEHLSGRLIAHHATSSNPLKKENFEHALEAAFTLEGKNVPPTDDPTRRGADLVVDGLRISLKTCSRKAKPLTSMDVSKFAECRWLREPLQRKDASEINRLMKAALNSHLQDYEKIIMFCNGVVGKFVTYKMIEIPKSIFQIANIIGDRDFATCLLKGTQTLTIPLLQNGSKVASLSLDGSVEKMRFLGINVGSCMLHAEWKVELP